MNQPGGITVDSYEGMRAAIRARAEELRMSRNMIDAAAGLSEANSARLLAPVPERQMMAETMLKMLAAVEFDVVLIPRPGAAERIAAEFGERADSHVRKTNIRSALRIAKQARLARLFRDPNFFKKIGRIGGAARIANHSPEEISRAAGRASRARWRKKKAKKLKSQ